MRRQFYLDLPSENPDEICRRIDETRIFAAELANALSINHLYGRQQDFYNDQT